MPIRTYIIIGLLQNMTTWFKLLEGNHITFNPLSVVIRFPAAVFTCSAAGERAFMSKHLFLADRDGDVMGDVQCPDGGNWAI